MWLAQFEYAEFDSDVYFVRVWTENTLFGQLWLKIYKTVKFDCEVQIFYFELEIPSAKTKRFCENSSRF